MFTIPNVKSGTTEEPESVDPESYNPVMSVFYLEITVCIKRSVCVCKTHPENDTLARVDAVRTLSLSKPTRSGVTSLGDYLAGRPMPVRCVMEEVIVVLAAVRKRHLKAVISSNDISPSWPLLVLISFVLSIHSFAVFVCEHVCVCVCSGQTTGREVKPKTPRH